MGAKNTDAEQAKIIGAGGSPHSNDLSYPDASVIMRRAARGKE